MSASVPFHWSKKVPFLLDSSSNDLLWKDPLYFLEHQEKHVKSSRNLRSDMSAMSPAYAWRHSLSAYVVWPWLFPHFTATSYRPTPSRSCQLHWVNGHVRFERHPIIPTNFLSTLSIKSHIDVQDPDDVIPQIWHLHQDAKPNVHLPNPNLVLSLYDLMFMLYDCCHGSFSDSLFEKLH